jgi:hypothetical protein
MLDNSVIFKWINYLETVTDEEFGKIVNDNAKNNNSNSRLKSRCLYFDLKLSQTTY